MTWGSSSSIEGMAEGLRGPVYWTSDPAVWPSRNASERALAEGRIAEHALCIGCHPEWGSMYNVYKPKCAFLPEKTAFSGYLWWSIPKGRKTGNYRGPNSPRWLWISPGAPRAKAQKLSTKLYVESETNTSYSQS